MTEPTKARILVVDDEASARAGLEKLLGGEGYRVETAESAEAALAVAADFAPDVVVTDLRMPGMDGVELTRRLREQDKHLPVILATAFGDVSTAVSAMRAGADDYLTKPIDIDALVVSIERARERRALRTEAENLRRHVREQSGEGLQGLIGASDAMQKVYRVARQVSGSRATVLITGESGTGKELVARAIHANSSRADRPFITVNCAAITETLLESELFGHTRGAFTGAVQARKGLFEEANGGTFFFDEIAETPPSFQAKLLRAIQDGEVRRLGDNHSFNVDVRIIASTNQELREMIADKTFREDLYYRLNVARFILPPLRERKEDIGPLVEHFLDKYGRKMRRNARLGDGVLDYLSRYDFPGNIRELENLIEQGIALSVDGLIQLDDIITPEMRPDARAARAQRSLQDVVDAAEREAIRNVLREVDGNKERAAELLGLSSTTLWRKMKRLDVVWPS